MRRSPRRPTLYGAMDGASKFVKGDAIAGLVIIIINLIGGIAIGIVQHGMAIDEAVSTYSLLTIATGSSRRSRRCSWRSRPA